MTPQETFFKQLAISLELADDLKDVLEEILKATHPPDITWEHVGDIQYIGYTLKALLKHIMREPE
jgi:hypothetical protein